MEKITYRQCTFKLEDEMSQLIQLQNEVYRSRGLSFQAASFRSWYVDNPVGGVISFNAFDGEKMVAHQSFVPELMLVNDEVLRCMRSMAVVTHPDYQGKGLFSKLTNMAVEEAKRQEYAFLYAVTNGNSFPAFVHKCGFQAIGQLQVKMGLGTRCVANEGMTYQRYWTEEILHWRLSMGQYFVHKGALMGRYTKGVCTLMAIHDSLPQLPDNLPTKHPIGVSLYVGLGAKLPPTYWKVPSFVKHSPFHLIFRDLRGDLPQMKQDNIFYQLIDYDVA